MSKTVLIVQPRIPQFRVDYFNGIIGLARKNDIHISVLIPDQINDSRKDESSDLVPHTSCKRLRLGVGKYRLEVMDLNLRIHNPDLVILEHAMRTFLIFLYLKFRGINVALWGHGVIHTNKESLVAYRLKKWMARQCCFYFVYTQGGRRTLLKQGLSTSRIHVMNNTIPNPFLPTNNVSRLTSADFKYEFVREHNLQGKKVLIFIGGIDDSKRLDFLLQSFAEVSNLDPKTVLLIFGEGPDKLRLQESSSSSKVIFLGKANIETKRMLAEIGSCILMPGRVGLIAVDSFQMKLPLITTKYKFHAPEFEYLIHGENSLISENDIPSFVKMVIEYLQDYSLQAKLKLGAQRSEKKYRLHDMQEGFVHKLLELVTRKEK